MLSSARGRRGGWNGWPVRYGFLENSLLFEGSISERERGMFMREHLPLQRVQLDPFATVLWEAWPATICSVRQILEHGLDLTGMTVIVGGNGVGKSTVMEAIAGSFGLNTEGGTHAARHATSTGQSDLTNYLQLVRGPGASRRGVFFRAETMHGHFSFLESIGLEQLHEKSHGEAFLEYISNRVGIGGLWLLDEPESALSFSGCLALLSLLIELGRTGSQIVLSTHSPVLAALPGAQILEFSSEGIQRMQYGDLQMVCEWRRFLESPERYLRYLS